MAKFPAMPLWTDAFIADTTHLTAAQTGALIMLLIVAWRSPDAKLPDNDDTLSRYARMPKRTWLANKEIILEGWQQDNLHRWYQPRLIDERKNVEAKRDLAVQAGKASALKYKDRHSTPVVDPLQPNDNHPKPKPKPDPKQVEREINLSVDFEEFWTLYIPVDVGKGSKQEAKEVFIKTIKGGVDYERIREGVRAYVNFTQRTGGKTKQVARWLRKSGWLDEYPDAKSTIGVLPRGNAYEYNNNQTQTWGSEGDRLAAKYREEAERERKGRVSDIIEHCV